jgi:pyridoxal phosphate enzyme (YggS family)
LGVDAFGESYLRAALPTMDALAGRAITWHFIGPIQSNKTREIAARFDWVHGIDRLKIAERLSVQRPEYLPPLEVCIQVNIDDEPNKSGVAPGELVPLACTVATLPRLRLRGLMAIPRPHREGDALREPFRRLRRLRETLVAEGVTLDVLSMGMSDDFKAAIAEGATHVRVGSALFGPR